jgi:hypothetical protein
MIYLLILQKLLQIHQEEILLEDLEKINLQPLPMLFIHSMVMVGNKHLSKKKFLLKMQQFGQMKKLESLKIRMWLF